MSEWLTHWLANWLANSPTVWLTHSSVHLLSDSTNLLSDPLPDWRTDWQTDWLAGWLAGYLADWKTDRPKGKKKQTDPRTTQGLTVWKWLTEFPNCIQWSFSNCSTSKKLLKYYIQPLFFQSYPNPPRLTARLEHDITKTEKVWRCFTCPPIRRLRHAISALVREAK